MNRHDSPGFVSFVSPLDGISPREENRYAYWLERLKSRKATDVLHDESAISSTDKTDKTGNTDLDADVAWRMAAMRAQVPQRGPIPFLVARLDLVTPCAPGRCGSCGDSLEEGRRYRCAFCQEAVWLALNQVREDVPTGDPTC